MAILEVAVNENIEPALLSVSEMCKYLSIGDSMARKLLSEHKNIFTVKIGSRVYANKKKLDEWIENRTGL